MGNSKHMLFWDYKTFLPVDGSARSTKIDIPDIISELTLFIVSGLKMWALRRGEVKGITFLFMFYLWLLDGPRLEVEDRRILYQIKEWQMVL